MYHTSLKNTVRNSVPYLFQNLTVPYFCNLQYRNNSLLRIKPESALSSRPLIGIQRAPVNVSKVIENADQPSSSACKAAAVCTFCSRC